MFERMWSEDCLCRAFVLVFAGVCVCVCVCMCVCVSGYLRASGGVCMHDRACACPCMFVCVFVAIEGMCLLVWSFPC